MVGDLYSGGNPPDDWDPGGGRDPGGGGGGPLGGVGDLYSGLRRFTDTKELKLKPLPDKAPGMINWVASVETMVVNNWPSYEGLLAWILLVSRPGTTYEQLADSGGFVTPDMILATALLYVVEHSKHYDLQAKVNRILQENRCAQPPVRLKGRQLMKVIMVH